MTDRPSMWSQVVRARWVATARCPTCLRQNTPGQQPILELHDDEATVYCNGCGHWFAAERPKVEPVG